MDTSMIILVVSVSIVVLVMLCCAVAPAFTRNTKRRRMTQQRRQLAQQQKASVDRYASIYNKVYNTVDQRPHIYKWQDTIPSDYAILEKHHR